jgi:hypothetical protein
MTLILQLIFIHTYIDKTTIFENYINIKICIRIDIEKGLQYDILYIDIFKMKLINIYNFIM